MFFVGRDTWIKHRFLGEVRGEQRDGQWGRTVRRSSCKHVPVPVKLQLQVRHFICFLKSQSCLFHTALNMNAYHYFQHFTRREDIFRQFFPVLVFKYSEQLHSTALIRQR